MRTWKSTLSPYSFPWLNTRQLATSIPDELEQPYIYFLCLWKGKEKAGPVSLLNTDLQTNDSLTNNGAVMVSFNFALGEGKVSVNL